MSWAIRVSNIFGIYRCLNGMFHILTWNADFLYLVSAGSHIVNRVRCVIQGRHHEKAIQAMGPLFADARMSYGPT